LAYRLSNAQTSKVPYTLILGDKEKEEKAISYRLHGQQETTTISIEDFITMIKEEITNKTFRK